ncbi:MAG TPA: hypothetical protein VN048_09420 [Verrucomicrobiae bacterium]|jgi:hypothetical protein|nr:hypothetical protein [Verrucomicrobiae bacterium]
MSLRQKIITGIALVVFAWAVWYGYRIAHTVNQIPTAYAAWDTGTLLVEYMKSHNNRWPSSWDDLLSVINTNSSNQFTLWGATADVTNYALTLRQKVVIDWKFDPSPTNQGSPVTRADGTKFEIVWNGAEPNDMVRRYLTSTHTNAPKSPPDNPLPPPAAP